MDSTEERAFAEERVRVDQRVETDEFPVPAVVLEVTSTRASAAPVRLSVDLTAEIETDAVGFHPDYGHQHWSVDGRTLVFERQFGPDESFTTVFAVRGIDDPSELLLDDVDIAVPTDGGPRENDAAADAADQADGVERVTDLVDESETEAVRELIAGERDDLPGLDDPARAAPADDETANAGTEADADEAGETIELSEPGARDRTDAATSNGSPGETVPATAPSEATAAGADDLDAVAPEAGDEPTAAEPATASESAARTAAVATGAGSVVDALVAELRAGDLSERDRTALRGALGEPEDGSTAARVEHLQQRMSDIEAYTDALETFLDDHGTGQQVVEELREEVDSLDADLADLRADLADVDEEFDAVHDELSSVGDTATAAENRVDDVEADVTAVETAVDGIEEEVDQVRGAVDDVRGEVDEELDEIRTEIREELRDEIVADVREEIAADLTTVREDLDAEIEELHEEIAEIEQFRDRVATVFGGDGSLDDF